MSIPILPHKEEGAAWDLDKVKQPHFWPFSPERVPTSPDLGTESFLCSFDLSAYLAVLGTLRISGADTV